MCEICSCIDIQNAELNKKGVCFDEIMYCDVGVSILDQVILMEAGIKKKQSCTGATGSIKTAVDLPTKVTSTAIMLNVILPQR